MGEPTERTPLVHANRDETQIWGDGCYQDGDDRTDRLYRVTCGTCLDSCAANGPWWMAAAALDRRHNPLDQESNWKAWYADHMDAVAARDRLRAVEARYTALVEAVDRLAAMDVRGTGRLCHAIDDLRAAREALKGEG